MNRTFSSVIGLVILAALFVAVNILAGALLRTAQIDFTEKKLYTLTQGSRNIVRSLEEPITLDLFYSAKLAAGRPHVQSYGKRVRELLQEFERASNQKINLRFHDPEPFSELEDQAVQYRLLGVPLGDTGERFYLGLVGSNAIGHRLSISYFDAADEEFLEYEISRMIYVLANPERRVLGLITSLEIGGAMADQVTGQRAIPAWQVARELSSVFQVRRIDPKQGRLPMNEAGEIDIDVLLIIHPKEIPPAMAYAIDQYVLGGGRAMIFVDTYSESDLPPNPNDQIAAMAYPTGSTMPELFRAWGINMPIDQTAADLRNAQEALFQVAPGQREPVSYIPWITLGSSNFNKDDLVTGRLSRLNFASSGILDVLPDATTSVTPLAWTSEQSMRMDTLKARFLPDPKRLTAEFVAGGEQLTLAARITGPAKTAFPDGPPEGAPITPRMHLTESVEPINVIVVADTDLLADRFWLSQDAQGRIAKIADNGDFLVNGLDHLSGSSDLISLRARGVFARPFDRVDELRAAAEEQYRAQERALQQEIRDTQTRIAQLQTQASDTTIVLPAEVERELVQLQEKLLAARRELRDVQLNLRREVEALGARVKLINTALAPSIIAIVAVGLGAYRASRRKADRRAMAQK